MATYAELATLLADSDLEPKIRVAVIIAAYNLITGTPTAADRAWAAAVLVDPQTEARKALRSVLAANKSASLATIQAATDAAIQTNVDAVVPQLVSAYSGA